MWTQTETKDSHPSSSLQKNPFPTVFSDQSQSKQSHQVYSKYSDILVQKWLGWRWEFSSGAPLFFLLITERGGGGGLENSQNVESNPEPKRAALPLVLAHHTHYLLGHKLWIYLSPRSLFSLSLSQRTCCYIHTRTVRLVCERIQVVFGWWSGQPCISPNP